MQDLLKEVRPVRLFEDVALQLYQLIAKGHLSGGDRLPSEKQLCETFKVSRASVREALRSLGALGIVEVKNGGGTYVRKGSYESIGAILSMVLFHDFDDIVQIYEARRAIEGWTSYAAARRITASQIAELEELVRGQQDALDRGESGVEEDFQFHLGIGKAAGNEVIIRLLHSMITLIFRVLDPSKRPVRDLRVAVEQHGRILEALRRRDSAGAMQEMLEHIAVGLGPDDLAPNSAG
ncbi:MAG: FadR family transcriptional regulator [Bryobacteraceae bacterium]|nr:FadR family transcriptional regulator [Bryobacteraceae bacterium]